MRRWMWCVSVLVVLWGCGEEAAQDNTCSLNSDCPPEASCIEGSCQVECVEDRDCPDGQACQRGQCSTEAVTCLADDECAYAHACVQGACEPIEGYCESNEECGAGQACSRETNRCIEDDGARPCDDVGDCFADEVCLEGRCVVDEGPPPCVLNSDCASAEICQNGQCVPGCESDGDCLAGQICQAGQCAEGCGSDVDCPADQICRQGRCSDECQLNSDCPGTQLCQDGRCVAECVEDRDCGQDRLCRNGQCVAECITTVDCGQGLVCEAGRCVEDDTPADPYTGTFLLSSPQPIQRCNAITSINYDSRLVQADQNGQGFTFTFSNPLTVYNGTVSEAGVFTVSWSGLQGATANCGELNTSNTYRAAFQNPDFLEGTLTVEFFFQLAECNCTLNWPIVGTRQ